MAASTAQGSPPQTELTVLVSSVASDAHTWNLVYLQLVLEELGHRVINLGACVPDDLLVADCLRVRPDLVVISTVNGHGRQDGRRVIGRIRAREELAVTPVVIGGKLGIDGPRTKDHREMLLDAGFDAVFEDGAGQAQLGSYVDSVRPAGVPRLSASVTS
jgi:methylaspartate mutase sigma subunit